MQAPQRAKRRTQRSYTLADSVLNVAWTAKQPPHPDISHKRQQRDREELSPAKLRWAVTAERQRGQITAGLDVHAAGQRGNAPQRAVVGRNVADLVRRGYDEPRAPFARRRRRRAA